MHNHQLEFAKQVASRQGNIILVEEIDELKNVLNKYDHIIEKMPKELASNNERFNLGFDKIVNNLLNV